MGNDYLCPWCRGHLRVNDNIIFSAETKVENGGLILINPTLGDYTIKKHQTFKFEQGEHVNFYCPICHAKLGENEKIQNLAKILMVDEQNNEYEVLFSEIYGEKCTYKIKENEIKAFGEHSSRYLEFLAQYPHVS
jgi:uncharacterized protein YbaR (Trm112 family)